MLQKMNNLSIEIRKSSKTLKIFGIKNLDLDMLDTVFRPQGHDALGQTFLKYGYVYKRFYVPKFGSVWGGGGQFDPSSEISAGKVWNGPEWLKWTKNKLF